MSSDPVGGYILFPTTLTRADLIAVTLKAMELASGEFEVLLPEDGFPRLPEDGYPLRTVEPPERALALLAQEESGVIAGKGLKGAETYWFEPVIASYPLVTLWVEPMALYDDKWPEHIDFFVKRWLQLCEQGQAVFGYFSPFSFMFERDYLQDKILPAFHGGSVRDLLEQITPGWLLYLGSELAERWRQEQMPTPSPILISQDLSSGAHFFRTSRNVAEASLSILH